MKWIVHTGISFLLFAMSGSMFGVCESEEYKNITFATIPGGTFLMGSDNGKYNEKPVRRVTLDTFKMSATPITNACYAEYLNAAFKTGDICVFGKKVVGETGDYEGKVYVDIDYTYNKNNKCWVEFENGVFTVTAGKGKWPVVSITWYGAKAFALYYDCDLPTEAEWEYAARGGKQYEYATNNGELSTENANYWDSVIKHPVNVGSYPPNPFGLHDMCGNALNWCNDWDGMYGKESEVNPTGPESGIYRIIRGSCHFSKSDGCRCSARTCSEPAKTMSIAGFRVVKRNIEDDNR
ncbi:MAG: SUMF1/EgtB/PvdO family nonheme iron enzyme [Candidatus Latescibacteria bacterium]|nr:SUMF1/EgtB/PvdO family nonheme iron enzyme [Candidatus Latescibacterota bacterium]